MYSESDNIEAMMSSKTDKIIEKLFNSFFTKIPKKVRRIHKRKWIAFDCVYSLHYKLHKISLNRGRSYIDSPTWIKNKKATINLKNNDDKCFHYVITVAWNHKQIKSHPERISNNEPFID